MISGVIFVVLVTIILLYVGLVIQGQFYTIAGDTDLGTEGNKTRDQMFNLGYQGFNLLVIALIILPAVAIITIVRAGFGA